jgi:hypothetical protein
MDYKEAMKIAQSVLSNDLYIAHCIDYKDMFIFMTDYKDGRWVYGNLEISVNKRTGKIDYVSTAELFFDNIDFREAYNNAISIPKP